jgi:cyclophilin family peptidyl-prolyl cis-trans isomerase
MTIDPQKSYTATIETVKGDLVCELFAADAPITVNNFVFLAREGFYDGVIFHRVVPNFVIQGGDPTGTGSGGPGYRFEDEFSARKHGTGALSMANAGPTPPAHSPSSRSAHNLTSTANTPSSDNSSREWM